MEAGQCRNKPPRNKVKEEEYIRKGRISKRKHRGKGTGGEGGRWTKQRSKTEIVWLVEAEARSGGQDDGHGRERRGG